MNTINYYTQCHVMWVYKINELDPPINIKINEKIYWEVVV